MKSGCHGWSGKLETELARTLRAGREVAGDLIRWAPEEAWPREFTHLLDHGIHLERIPAVIRRKASVLNGRSI